MTETASKKAQKALDARFGDAPYFKAAGVSGEALQGMLARGSCRHFEDKPVPEPVLEVLCAAALASPSKSDLQQRDIILLKSPEARRALAGFVADQAWIENAPMIAVFCGNNRRHRRVHDLHGIPFVNDHLDAFFNAAADAAIALGAFVTAAEAIGLGCCPISAVRNRVHEVSDLLGLPEHVFPFAGLALGYPKWPPRITMRLPLGVTCHTDRYQEQGVDEAIQSYDAERNEQRPFATQRLTETYGAKENYGWSDDKARQYSVPERADFGAYVRAQGFDLE